MRPAVGRLRVDKQHEKGKLTARERIESFTDRARSSRPVPSRKNRTAFGMDTADMPADVVTELRP